MRWANEDRWLADITEIANRHGVPVPMVLAIIAVESGFRPDAFRQEANDASYGLMQILTGTAHGVGFSGEPSELLDPVTNIEYGTAYLAEQWDRAGGDPAAAASAYNGGWRPDIGFGARATRPLTICLMRDTAGNCVKTHNVQPGEFSNQSYADAVLANLQYFQAKQASSTGVTQFVRPTTETGAVNPKLVGVLVAILIALLGARFMGQK